MDVTGKAATPFVNMDTNFKMSANRSKQRKTRTYVGPCEERQRLHRRDVHPEPHAWAQR